jgi:hypothetical protein
MSLEHYSDLKVLLVGWDGKQNLGAIVKTVSFVVEFAALLLLELAKLTVHALVVGVDFRVPAQLDSLEL